MIHNLNYWAPFPIDQDGYLSPAFQVLHHPTHNTLHAPNTHLIQDILSRTRSGATLPWHISLQEYYFRKEWELFDRKVDPHEFTNVAYKPRYQPILASLQSSLASWQNLTGDPWLCSPHAVLENTGEYKRNMQCMLLDN